MKGRWLAPVVRGAGVWHYYPDTLADRQSTGRLTLCGRTIRSALTPTAPLGTCGACKACAKRVSENS